MFSYKKKAIFRKLRQISFVSGREESAVDHKYLAQTGKSEGKLLTKSTENLHDEKGSIYTRIIAFGLLKRSCLFAPARQKRVLFNQWRIGFQEWNDVNLRWNSSEYGGVKDLRIPPHRIWKPDVLMYNRYVENVTSHS